MSSIRGSAGGAARALILKREALEKYYSNPNTCKQCSKIIEVSPNQRVGETRAKQFCNNSCAAIYSNKHRETKSIVYTKPCGWCSKEFSVLKTSWLKGRKFCSKSCASLNKNVEWRKKNPKKLCIKCGTAEVFRRRKKCDACLVPKFVFYTKGQLFGLSSTWQSARSRIRKNAAAVWERSGKPLSCSKCSYSLYVEIAHIKAVSDFPDDATIEEINSIDNLLALCPNCHWEFDNLKRNGETVSFGSHTPELSVQL